MNTISSEPHMVSVSLQARSKGMSTAVGWEINGAQASLDHPHQANPDDPSEYIWEQLEGVRWRSRVRLWYLAGTPGTSPRFPLLTLHEAGSSMYGYGDFDGPVFRPSAGEFDRYGGRANLPFGATLRGSPAGAGRGLCPL